MVPVQTLSLVSILLSQYLTEGVITNISVIQIPQWFFPLTPYEAVFAGLTFLWICMLGYIGVIPMNLNNLFYGSPSGRRRRREILNRNSSYLISSQNNSRDFATENVVNTILSALKRLDRDECVPRTLCELEHQINFGYEPPNQIQQLLNVLKWSHLIRDTNSNSSSVDTSRASRLEYPLAFYCKAVNYGYSAERIDINGTGICQERYASCPLTVSNILNYVSILHFDDF